MYHFRLGRFFQYSKADASSTAERPQLHDVHFASTRRQEQLRQAQASYDPANEWSCSDGTIDPCIRDSASIFDYLTINLDKSFCCGGGNIRAEEVFKILTAVKAFASTRF